MAQANDLFGDELPEGARPAVFMFQPHSFETVAPERLAEWERGIQTDFGMAPAQFADDAAISASWSNSGDGEICADDSDVHAVSRDRGGDPGDGGDRPGPAIFMHQPSRFAYVAGDRLDEWERLVRERVGLPVSGFSEEMLNTATLSATLPNDCMDDSDMHSE